MPCLSDEYLSPSKECLKCKPPCDSCLGPNEDQCLSCLGELSLDPVTWRCLPCCKDSATKSAKNCCVCDSITKRCAAETEQMRSATWLVRDSATHTYDLSVQRVTMTVVVICLGAVVMFFVLFGLLEWSSSSGGSSSRAGLFRQRALAQLRRAGNGYSRLSKKADRARFEVEAEKVALTRSDGIEEDDEDDEEIFHKTT